MGNLATFLAVVGVLAIGFVGWIVYRVSTMPVCPGCARPPSRCSCEEDRRDLAAQRRERAERVLKRNNIHHIK